jgi:hypothetical protein
MRYDSVWEVEAPMRQYGYGVWDEVNREWVARHLAGEAASWHATVLNLRYDRKGERPVSHAWYRDQAQYVERRITLISLLYDWSHDC